MLKKYNKMNDITKILIAMLLGSLLGILLGEKATCIGFIGTICQYGGLGNVHHQYCPEAGSHRSILSHGQCPGKIRHQPAAHHVQAFRYLLFVLHPSSDSGILFDFMAVYRHYPSEFLEKELSDHRCCRQYLQQCCSDSSQHECGQRKF